MKYMLYNLNKLKEEIDDDSIYEKCRKRAKDFTRNRKLTPKDIIYYTLNNRGKTTKMELYDFIEQYDYENVSDAALLKQREKLNEEIFKELNKSSLKDFYNLFKPEVKTYKGYLLTAIDGSDCEVPNTPLTRERYQSKNKNDDDKIARIKLSNCYDLLNNYVLDTEIGKYKQGENELAEKHMEVIEEITGDYPVVSIRDRGYMSLSYILRSVIEDKKFLIRYSPRYFKQEQKLMTSNDEWIEIQPIKSRLRKNIKEDEKINEYYKNQGKIKVRFVNIELATGEVETLITNLESEKITTEDINKIYQLRWGIETSYAYLKESMMITNISSSKESIIKQEIYSQMMVYNIVQSIANDVGNKIDQDKYKHKMKININMAIGFVKRYLIKILIEEKEEERNKLKEILFEKILKDIVPIRKERQNKRNNSHKNKHPINKRKAI